MKLADLKDVRALSTREKLELVDELWADMANDLENMAVTDAEKRILDERWAAFLRNPDGALTVEQLMARVESLRA